MSQMPWDDEDAGTPLMWPPVVWMQWDEQSLGTDGVGIGEQFNSESTSTGSHLVQRSPLLT